MPHIVKNRYNINEHILAGKTKQFKIRLIERFVMSNEANMEHLVYWISDWHFILSSNAGKGRT